MILAVVNPYDYSSTIETAASRARGDRLNKLYELCESQKTISTRKLERLVDELHETDRLDAIHFRYLADRLEEIGKGEAMSHKCPSPGCTIRVPKSQFSCKEHWYSLPGHMRDSIQYEYRYRHEDSGRAHIIAMLDAVNYLKAQVKKET